MIADRQLMKPGEYQVYVDALEQMLTSYRKLRTSNMSHASRIKISLQVTQRTEFTRRQLEALLTVAVERLTET